MSEDAVGKVARIPLNQYINPESDCIEPVAKWTVECPHCGHLMWFSRDPRVRFPGGVVRYNVCGCKYLMEEKA